MGLVGLLNISSGPGLPHAAAGMHGTMMGYVVSHPMLGARLAVLRNGREAPVLAFKYDFKFVKADGAGSVLGGLGGGLEDFSARGTLVVYYNPAGFTNEVVSRADSIRGGEEIERDNVDFRGRVDFNTHLVHLSLDETSVATREFEFRGLTLKTPLHRTARDVLEGEFNADYLGVAIASAGTMPWKSASQKLLALSGTPPENGPFTF